MFKFTPLQVLSVVKIAPGRGGAPINCGVAITSPSTTEAKPMVLFICFIIYFIFFCLFLALYSHSHGDPRRVRLWFRTIAIAVARGNLSIWIDMCISLGQKLFGLS